MRPTYGAYSSAPSSLVRFLRTQTQEIYFFTPNSKSASCVRPKVGRCPPNARYFKTSHCPQAAVEASILNLDFLRPSPKQGTWNPPKAKPLSRPNVPSNRKTLEKTPSCRHTSTDSLPFLRRFWQPKRRKGDSTLKPNDLPLLPSFLNDGNGSVLGRSKLGKLSNELKLRCTEVNENGDVTLVNGEFKKAELIAKV